MAGILPVLPEPVGFLLIPQFTVIALSSAIEPLRIANRYVTDKYRWLLLSMDGGPVPDGNGISVNVNMSVRDAGPLGTVLICADLDPDRHATKPLIRWLQKLARQGTHLGGLDTGMQILARGGLLDGYRVTTHWEIIPAFRERFPQILVTPSLFEVDRDRLTCAGGTAAIDMMLYAIEKKHGHDIAIRVSEHCIHERIRGASESQRMTLAERFGVHHPKLLRVLQFMEDNLEEPLHADELAVKVGISVRQLLRLFRDNFQSSPSRFYLRLRLDRARRLMKRTDMSVIEIANACGFRSHSHFTRAYRCEFGHPPRIDRRISDRRVSMIMDR